jgi:hypothetical protein
MDLTDTFLRVKILISITLILSLGGINSITAQSATATYTAGDIPTNVSFSAYDPTCNGPLTPLVVTIPVGATVTSVEVSYSMTARRFAWMSEQMSQIYCAETTNDEGGYLAGTGFGGTFAYNRTGLTLANGVSATGTLTFQMRAFRTYTDGSVPFCGVDENKIDNNTWIIIVNYINPVVIFPGGVSSNIALWLKADDGPLNTGTGIASTDGQTSNTWEDKSGARTNDATDATLTPPIFRNNFSDEINFNPTIDFDGTTNQGLDFGNDYLYSTGTGTEDGMTWFAVVEPDNPGATRTRQFVIDFGRYTGRGYSLQYGNTNLGMNTPTNAGVGGVNSILAHTNGLVPALSRFTVDFGNDQTFSLNGELTPSITNSISVNQLTAVEINESATHTANHGPVTIGRQSKTTSLTANGGRRLDGSISEIIGFKEDLSVTDIRRVESYLAIKYGITLDNTAAGLAGDYESSAGTPIWDASSNLGYHNDVFGIGRSDTSALGQVKSHSINTGAVAIFEAEAEGTNSANSFVDIDDDEFLIAGNNSLSMTHTQSGVFPLYKNRTNRIWKTQSTGQLGSITVSVILTNTGVISDYGLHTDLDGDFTTLATNYVCDSISGDTLIFNNVIFPTGSHFFTLGFEIAGHVVATSPFCGAITISDTVKTVGLKTALLWLKSNKGTSTTTDGASVSDWDDNTTNANHVTQPTAGDRPTYRDNATDNLNFNPTIEFVNDHLFRAAPGVFVPSTAYNHINSYFVFKDKDKLNFDWVVHEGGADWWNRYSFNMNYGGGAVFQFDNTPLTARTQTNTPPVGITYLYSFNRGIVSVYGNASNQTRAYSLNGTQTVISNTAIPAFTGTNNPFYIGNQVLQPGDSPNNPFDGYFGEILIIDDEVSLIEHQQIETYLAIKYGLTLGHNYIDSDTNVIFDISSGYANGIFGIGRSSTFELYHPKSKSESDYSGVTIEATVSIGEENYLIIGHDGAAITRITLAGESNVLTRKWLAKMAKGLGTVSMELDLATIGANTALPASNVKIGISHSPAFTNTKWIEATSVVAGVAYFSGIPLYDKYFTFSAAP